MSATVMTIELEPRWKVLQKVRGEPIPEGRTIRSKKAKERDRERRDFRQNRHRMDF
jgi:hypothetical protein